MPRPPRTHSVPNVYLARPARLHTMLAIFFTIATLPPAHALDSGWDQGGTQHITQSIDSSRDITLQHTLTLNIDPGHVVRLHGRLTGPDSSLSAIIKNGAGRLELRGDNSGMEKEVVLREGVLHLSGRYALGADWRASLQAHAGTTLSYESGAVVAAVLHLHDAATPPGGALPPAPGAEADAASIQWRVDTGVATQIGTILGTTPLVKRGTGTLRLSEASPMPDSRLTVAEGEVHLTKQFAGHIRVNDGALLSGAGRVGWLHIARGAILAPTGQLTVDNTLHFEPGGILHIHLWPDGRHDSVQVTQGPAALDGHVVALPQGGRNDWRHGMDAVIVQASAGLGPGRFASVTSALPYLEPSLSYDPQHVTLHLQPRSGGLSPTTPDQTGGWAASLRNMLLEDSRFIRDAAYAHGGTGRSFWSHAFHSSGQRPGRGSRHGHERRINGMLLGVNRDIGNGWTLGAYGGASGSTATGHSPANPHNAITSRLQGPRASADSVHLGWLAHHRSASGAQLTAGVAYSRHRLHSQRTATAPLLSDTLTSHYRVDSTQIFARAHHPVWPPAQVQDASTDLSAFTDLAWVRMSQSGHTEQGGPLALHLRPDRRNTLFTRVGLSIRHRMQGPQGPAILTGNVAWRHALGNTDTPVRHHFRDDARRRVFNGHGMPVARQAWQLQMGLQAGINKHAQLGVHYAGQHGQGSQDHGVQAHLTVRW